jgi:hypothetical protein
MITALTALSLLLGFLGIYAYQWITFLPNFPISFHYHMRLRHAVMAVLTLTPAYSALALNPSTTQAVLAGLATLLAAGHGFLVPTRGMPAIHRPGTLSVERAGLGDAAMVLGLALEHEARAWPVETLIPHHLANDVLEGRPLLFAWCHACRTGLVYAAEVDGQKLTFDVNAVYRRNMVMRDRETGSLWQQATGECLIGPLKGRSLEVLLGELEVWGAWKAAHPQTQVGMDTEKWSGLLPARQMTRMLDIATAGAHSPGRVLLDSRISPTEEMVGLVIAGEARAWSVASLQKRGELQDTLGGTALRLEASPNSRLVRAYRADDREGLSPLPIQRGRWLGWQEFHPTSSFWLET